MPLPLPLPLLLLPKRSLERLFRLTAAHINGGNIFTLRCILGRQDLRATV